MPITELATFETIPPYNAQSIPLLKLLQTLAQRQSAQSAFPVLFFSDTRHSSKIYALSGWHDVDASQAWLDSPEWLEMEAVLEPFRKLEDRMYLDINFDTIPRGGTMCVRRYRGRRNRNLGDDKTGTLPSAFWEASGIELDAQVNTMYCIEVYQRDEWEATSILGDVWMRPLALV